MTTINDLNDRFGLADRLNFTMAGDGIIIANVQTAQCTARIAMQGAQVLEWTPMGQKPVIWLSKEARFIPGKSLRGGVPVCWPWFGAHESNTDFPAHGYARMVPWQLQTCVEAGNGAIKLVFSIVDEPNNRKLWPFNSPLDLHMQLGEQLELELITRNADSQPIQISEALHTYFAVGDVRRLRVSGLDKCTYLDKVRDFARTVQEGDIQIDGEVDRVYLDTQSECVIEDETWQRRIHINKKGSQTTVVWNPWLARATEMGDMGKDGYLDMLCVESANAASNFVTIEPGAEHRLWVRYHLD